MPNICSKSQYGKNQAGWCWRAFFKTDGRNLWINWVVHSIKLVIFFRHHSHNYFKSHFFPYIKGYCTAIPLPFTLTFIGVYARWDKIMNYRVHCTCISLFCLCTRLVLSLSIKILLKFGNACHFGIFDWLKNTFCDVIWRVGTNYI